MKKKILHFKQADTKDCGPTCLKIIVKYFNKDISVRSLRDLNETTRVGSSLLGLSDTAEELGLRSLGVKLNLEHLEKAELPCIVHWNKNHYAVLYKIRNDTKLYI